ncbi:hypothetical protein GDO81_021338 [Engystomops pustulosus]|uniref:Uncharacterized protein n=1 Tax=Engystomops pustulosus TaxID=76066 RepID=A0AAV6YPS3_ENGPU|nr:hypothetical protein GDO81_021338 [Engystomops pustulosus]
MEVKFRLVKLFRLYAHLALKFTHFQKIKIENPPYNLFCNFSRVQRPPTCGRYLFYGYTARRRMEGGTCSCQDFSFLFGPFCRL